MSSIVLTEADYQVLPLAREYAILKNPGSWRGYQVSPIYTDQKVSLNKVETADEVVRIGISDKSLFRNKPTKIATVSGKYPYYSDCLQVEIKDSFVCHLISDGGALEQLPETYPRCNVPYHFLSETYPCSGYQSFDFPVSDTFPVKRSTGGIVEFMVSEHVYVNTSTRKVYAFAGDFYFPAVSVSTYLRIGKSLFVAYSWYEAVAGESSLWFWSKAGYHKLEPQTILDALMAEPYLRVIPLSTQKSESITSDMIDATRRWADQIDPKSLLPQILDIEKVHYPENELAVEAFKSFRVKDATLLRELMDSMGDLAGLKKLGGAIPGLDALKQTFHSETFKDLAKNASGLYLAGKFGIQTTIDSLLAWSHVYTDGFLKRLDEQLFPTALRAVKNKNIPQEGRYGLSGSAKFVINLGVSTFDDWRDYINAFYRWGLLLSISDGYDLIPLSFVLDWIWSGIQAAANTLTAMADSYRLNLTYAFRSSKLDLTWRLRGPALPIMGAATIEIPVKVYHRVYSNKLPSLSLWETLNQESTSGTLNISSLPSAVALLISFLT